MRLLRRTGSYLPGAIALRIDPDYLSHTGKPEHIVMVTGTNGKTSVCNMLRYFIESAGQHVMDNREAVSYTHLDVYKRQSYEFDAITSCVVGGVSLSGGVGTVFGTITGVIIFTVITYGLTFIGVNANWQLIIKGLIICTSVALEDVYKRQQ